MAKSATKVAGGVTIKSKTAAASDIFVDVAKQVESLSQEKAFDLVHDLMEDAEANFFKVGGILAHIQDESGKEGGEEWLDGCDSFKGLIETKFNLQYRKAMYLISIYKQLVEKQIPWPTVADLGWTKLKELAPVLTPKNAEGWAKKAKGMTVLQLQEAVKNAQAKGKGSNAEESTKPEVTTITFKVHPDQKETIREALDKVKEETGTDVDTMALFNLSQAYLGNSVSITTDGDEEEEVKPKGKKGKAKAGGDEDTLKALMEEVGAEKVLEIFGELFPEVDVQVSM